MRRLTGTNYLARAVHYAHKMLMNSTARGSTVNVFIVS
jgi:hypothetical protein